MSSKTRNYLFHFASQVPWSGVAYRDEVLVLLLVLWLGGVWDSQRPESGTLSHCALSEGAFVRHVITQRVNECLYIFMCSGLLQNCLEAKHLRFIRFFTENIFVCVDNTEKYSFLSVIENCKNIFRTVKVVFSRGKPVTDMGRSLYHRVGTHSPVELTAVVSYPSCLELKICPFWFLNSEKLNILICSLNLASFSLLSSNNLLFTIFKIVIYGWINVGFLLLKGSCLSRVPAEQAAAWCYLGGAGALPGEVTLQSHLTHGDFVACTWSECLWISSGLVSNFFLRLCPTDGKAKWRRLVRSFYPRVIGEVKLERALSDFFLPSLPLRESSLQVLTFFFRQKLQRYPILMETRKEELF